MGSRVRVVLWVVTNVSFFSVQIEFLEGKKCLKFRYKMKLEIRTFELRHRFPDFASYLHESTHSEGFLFVLCLL